MDPQTRVPLEQGRSPVQPTGPCSKESQCLSSSVDHRRSTFIFPHQTLQAPVPAHHSPTACVLYLSRCALGGIKSLEESRQAAYRISRGSASSPHFQQGQHRWSAYPFNNKAQSEAREDASCPGSPDYVALAVRNPCGYFQISEYPVHQHWPPCSPCRHNSS